MADEELAVTSEKLEDLSVENEDGLALNLTKKKKKKKKDAAEEETAANAGEAAGDDALALNLGGEKKKKKKKKERREFDEEDGEEAAAGGDEAEATTTGKHAWSGSDRDYTYDELLDRVFGILKEKNPELTGERRRTILRPPQVAKEGTKKTVFTNFMELCKAMNRNQEHVSAYLLAELGTSGSLDGQQRLIVKGRFLPKSFETVLRRYVGEYVLCPGCKSVDTLLDRDSATRLMHLRCQQCGASRTVSAIKSGFIAQVGRRAKTAG